MQQMMRESDIFKVARHVIFGLNRTPGAVRAYSEPRSGLGQASKPIVGDYRESRGKGARSESPTPRKYSKPNLDGCAFMEIIHILNRCGCAVCGRHPKCAALICSLAIDEDPVFKNSHC